MTHDAYGKRVMSEAFGSRFRTFGKAREIDYGGKHPAQIDGTLDGIVAVEIEARTAKQVRGAILDLRFHPYPKKLLLLMPSSLNMNEGIKGHSEFILSKLMPNPGDYRVIALGGCGRLDRLEADVALVKGEVAAWLSIR
jgi:hypothetical protein